MLTVVVILAWVGVGFILGLFVNIYHAMMHGDTETNERIREIRQTRIRIEEKKLNVVLRTNARRAIVEKIIKALKELEVDDSQITTAKTDQRRTNDA